MAAPPAAAGPEYMLENAILDQLEELIDTPWRDCLAAAAAGTAQGLEDGIPAMPSSNSGSFRQLAPAVVDRPDAMEGGYPPPRRPSIVSAAPEPLREQDRLLPMANVARLMAAELGKDAKISRDAKILMQEMVSEFICFITAEANDFAIAEGKKAITQEDLLSSFDSLGAHTIAPRPLDMRSLSPAHAHGRSRVLSARARACR